MSNGILVVNAGSSSLKVSVHHRFAGSIQPALHGHVEAIGKVPRFHARDAGGNDIDTQGVVTGREVDHAAVLDRLLDWLQERTQGLTLQAAGHRIVHGGSRFADAVRLKSDVLRDLDALAPLAPLHQPHNLAPVRALWRRSPDLPQVACFDTAFHRTQPEIAQHFALPRPLTEEGIRRYGFHGLSYEYIAQVLPEYAGAAANGRVVVAHLGHGASMCALRNGRSIATTMGFTALDGLPMGKRCGDLDPGVVLYMLQEKGWSAKDVEETLYHRSGMYGVSGLSDSMQDLLESSATQAEEAVALFCYRANRELGSLVAALGGLDVLVFTAGIGEHAPEIRRRICAQASWLGISVDPDANDENATIISSADSRVSVHVIPTDEEQIIAQHTARLCNVRA